MEKTKNMRKKNSPRLYNTSWEEFYKKRGQIQSKVRDIVEDLLEFKKSGKTLDLGCGTGRHSFFLANNGFEVYAGDVSETAMKIVKEVGKAIQASVFSKEKIPFEDNFFDVVVVTTVFSHSLIKDIKESVKEIDRTLKSGGLIVLCDLSTNDSHFKKGKKVEENSFEKIPGLKPSVHHFFTKQELLELFKDYKVLKYYENKHFFVLHNFILEKM